MTKRCLVILAVGMLAVGMLGGCATTTKEDLGGLVRAENPEYFAHPLRVIALGTHLGGNILQYGVMEPFYLLLAAPIPDAVGLSLEERRYLEVRGEEWRKFIAGERPAYQ
jgi:hypothetical protein